MLLTSFVRNETHAAKRRQKLSKMINTTFKQVQSRYENEYELFKAAELCKV